MLFLYVGLGIAMMSGISAMMQIGNSVNNLIFLSDPMQNEKDNYQPLAKFDRDIMEILLNYNGPSNDVCLHVKNNINDVNNIYQDRVNPPSSSSFLGYCSLVNTENQHRVLINKNESGSFPYNLFSCYLKNEKYCSFEMDFKLDGEN